MATTRPVLSASREGRNNDQRVVAFAKFGRMNTQSSAQTSTQDEEEHKRGDRIEKLLTPSTMTRVVSSINKMNFMRQRTLASKGNVTASCPLRRFEPSEVEREMTRILQTTLKSVEYEPARAANLSKHLSETIRGKVKAMKFPRYKIIAVVTITSRSNQCLVMGSRCLWSTSSDSSATARYTTDNLAATATVFAILKE